MSTSSFCVEQVQSLTPQTSINNRPYLMVTVEVNDKQRARIAEEMIGKMGSEDAYNWARATFPEWFEEEQS